MKKVCATNDGAPIVKPAFNQRDFSLYLLDPARRAPGPVSYCALRRTGVCIGAEKSVVFWRCPMSIGGLMKPLPNKDPRIAANSLPFSLSIANFQF